MEPFKRKTPEEILESIYKLQRGRFKIYMGAINGSGKTYHMLQEGQSLKRQGVDVGICALSTVQHSETLQQIGDLERIPSIHWHHNGRLQKDLPLERILARNPEVILVDDLAHHNRADALFPTRLEDINFLLNKGISVITTLNVYELEELAEVARKLTGVVAQHTVPAHVMETADEVRLIDVTPETLLERLSEGHLHLNNRALFERKNLGTLRELALRLVAEGVNDSLERHREKAGLIGPSGASERILVSAQYHWNGSIYVRRGQQVAKRLGGDLRVVTFVQPNKVLSKEEAAFKRSLQQLVQKVDGIFEELPFHSRRSLSRKLVHYAVENNVTRIVLGHSRMSLWQELWKGSFGASLLRRVKNIDLLFVADSSDRERILPAKSRQEGEHDPYHRLSAQEIESRIQRIKRGKLKLYIGAAPGVGKTYAMLREGNDLLKKKIDVIIGFLETHGRAETQEQIGELPLLPRLQLDYRGTKLEEMDTDAIIRRNPEVVLIDELAHTNVPGSQRRKRYEDVLEILNTGISVISTMNVQHLESLNDAVEQNTGIRVRETVPDQLLRIADEVQLIDIPPAALRNRMKEGKIYSAHKIDQALNSFFKTGNLIALRELALREIADDVDERLEAWERKASLRGPWRRKETICVGITASSNAERLIRRGFRIAYRLKADWYVLYVHSESDLNEEMNKRMKAVEELTSRLGGSFIIKFARKERHIAASIIDFANEQSATQIILGQSKLTPGSWLRKGAVIKTVLRHARHIDLLIVADFDPNVTTLDP